MMGTPARATYQALDAISGWWCPPRRRFLDLVHGQVMTMGHDLKGEQPCAFFSLPLAPVVPKAVQEIVVGDGLCPASKEIGFFLACLRAVPSTTGRRLVGDDVFKLRIVSA